VPRPTKPATNHVSAKASGKPSPAGDRKGASASPPSASSASPGRSKRAGARGAPTEPEVDLEGPLPRVLVAHPHVRCDVHVLGGSPHVIDSRVPVRRLWAWHRGGASVETLFKRYPALGQAKVLDALAFAYDNQDLVDTDLAREQALFARHGHPSVGARPLAQLALFDDDEA